MSAFLDNQYHCGILAEFAAKHNCLLVGTATTAAALGKIFYEAKLMAVCERYEDNPKCYGPYVHNPVWALLVENYKPVEIIKAVKCLDYNCSSAEDWEESAAYIALERIKSTAIRLLPGYNQAQWELEPR